MIRRIGSDEVELFRELRLESLRLEPHCFASSAEDWEKFSDEDWRRRLIRSDVFLVFSDFSYSGIAALTRHRGSKIAHRANIGMVYIRENQRGTGEGGQLMDAVAKHARSIGVSQLELAVSSANSAAIRLYEKKGFVEVGRIPNGFVHNGLSIADILMARQI